MAVRPVRNGRAGDLAAFGLRLEAFGFDGTFLSIALDLPPEARDGLRRRHLARLDAALEVERPLEVFARLNVRHGPNVEQMVLPLRQGPDGGAASVEFDLAHSGLGERHVGHVWVDLILERPAMNQVTLRDLARAPRADL